MAPISGPTIAPILPVATQIPIYVLREVCDKTLLGRIDCGGEGWKSTVEKDSDETVSHAFMHAATPNLAKHRHNFCMSSVWTIKVDANSDAHARSKNLQSRI